ncbi:hypothetical protein WHI96_07695 [Pseudonocardia tropica]|uniref:Uncharacterized protein n=1 Tax=Pseudonocardia tropica TaxID=681289 RepID=A0ABV1JS04_9PSEU
MRVWFARSVSGESPLGPPKIIESEMRAARSGSGWLRPSRSSANRARASS